MVETFCIETERLIIREWRDSDFEPFRAIATDPEVMRYISQGIPWTDAEIAAFIRRQRENVRRFGFCLGVLEARQSGELLGQAGLQPLGTTNDYEVGWWLARSRWRQGLGFEAAHGAVRFAFESAKLARVVAIAHPENRASRRIMEKLGMQFEGLHSGQELGLRVPDVEVVLYSLAAPRKSVQ
jgi:ribosomal-protein-alanine N-acetyltransferase